MKWQLKTIKEMKGKKIMTCKHCLKYQYNACPKEHDSLELQEPLYLVDEYNKAYELVFNCADCVMEIYF